MRSDAELGKIVYKASQTKPVAKACGVLMDSYCIPRHERQKETEEEARATLHAAIREVTDLTDEEFDHILKNIRKVNKARREEFQQGWIEEGMKDHKSPAEQVECWCPEDRELVDNMSPELKAKCEGIDLDKED
jgi:hypothetical protein